MAASTETETLPTFPAAAAVKTVSPLSAEAYTHELSTLFEAHIASRRKQEPNKRVSTEETFEPLVALLGCRHIEKAATSESECETPAQPPVAAETTTHYYLMLLLRSHFETDTLFTDEGTSILDGLLRNDRWRACLHTTSDRYAFTILLLDYAGLASDLSRGYYTGQRESMLSTMVPSTLTVLNDWLNPALPLTDLPSREQLAKLLFGETWCDLLAAMDMSSWSICATVYAQHPPFLTGLLPAHLVDCAETLPDLGAI